jgi:hypothetical protein
MKVILKAKGFLRRNDLATIIWQVWEMKITQVKVVRGRDWVFREN